MSGMRLILLGVLGVALAGTVGAASASAEGYEVSGGTLPEKMEGSRGVAKWKSTLAKAEIVVTCNGSKTHGEFKEKGVSKGETVFDECSAGNSKETFGNCEVPNIDFKYLAQLDDNTKGEVQEEYSPESSTKSEVEIEIKNKGEKTCAEKGKYPIQGTQACELPKAEELAKEHEIKCAASSGELTFEGEPATFEDTGKVKLTSGREWRAKVTQRVTVSTQRILISTNQVISFTGRFVLTNHGPGEWIPTVDGFIRGALPGNGATFGEPTNTCVAGVAADKTCEVVQEITQLQAG